MHCSARALQRVPKLTLIRRTMTTQMHYEGHSASSYESAYFYSAGDYTDYLSKMVVKRLGLEPTTCRRILDIGGGTGNFTRMIVKNSPEVEAIVIDPFLEGQEESTESSTASIKFVKAPAESLSEQGDKVWWRHDYHQVLLKEVIHHIHASDRVNVFAGIYRDLPQRPSADPGILIITRPQTDIDYPLWEEARQVWAENQPSLKELRSELEQAGFTQISNTIEGYPCEIEFERWISMIKNRFWSTFSNFTDDELEEACQRMRVDEAYRIDDNGKISFEDRLLVIAAYQ
jgi:SAM-dependent methyltransferase